MVLTDVERMVSNVAVQAPLGLKIERAILLFTFALQNCFNKLQEKMITIQESSYEQNL